ncbi:MAG: DMT family transporter [Cyanobacteria bacterium SBLK]|nr:DMT family transporter [Cyanobacteria bacterium SBLK]
MFASLICYAYVPILIKLSEFTLTPNATTFNRFWIAAAIMGCWNSILTLKNYKKKEPPNVQIFPNNFQSLWLPLLLLGIFSGTHQLLYAWSFTQTSVANSEVLHSLTPLFTAWFGWIFLNQQFERRFLLGIAIAIGGSIALVAHDFSITFDKLQGDGLALVSAIFWGGCLLVLEKLQSQLSAIVITTWNEFIGTLFLLPILLEIGDNLIPTSGKTWAILTTMGIIGIFARLLITYSLKQLSSGLVATILLLHPAITAILAWIIFSETLSFVNLLGFIIILLGVYLATLSKGGIKEIES